MVFKTQSTITRQELKSAGRQILERFNDDGPQSLKDPIVRKRLEENDGIWTVGNYLAYSNSMPGLKKLKLAIANDTELLMIGNGEEPVANTLALRGDSNVRSALLRKTELFGIRDRYGHTPVQIIQLYGNKEEKRAAEMLLIMDIMRSDSLKPRDIRRISKIVRDSVLENGPEVLKDRNARKFIFAAMENGWSVAHSFAHGRGSKLKRKILAHFATDPEILALSTKPEREEGSGITVESLIRQKSNPVLNRIMDETLANAMRG